MSRLPRIGPQAVHTFLLAATTIAGLSAAQLTFATAQTSSQDLKLLFQNPPDAAKPMVRWWWFGPAVEKPEILRELQQMKTNGIGGVELAFVYPEVVDSPQHKNLPFLSPEMLQDVAYANTEARKLGLRVDVTLCSGWPYGGPHISLEQAATGLRTVEIPIATNATSFPQVKPGEGEVILTTAIAEGTPKHWTLATTHLIDQAAPIPTSTTPRIALYFLQSHTLQQVKRAAVGAEGYVLDPFSREAVANHLKSVGEPLLKAFGDTPPYAIFSDSLEAYGADWTPTLPAEFQKRRGYDLIPHLPELVAGGTPAAEKVRRDYGLTLTELVNANYLTQINDWAIAHHTKFRSQTYGTPAVSFSSQNLAALPEGEGPQWRAFSTLRWATSANHVFGNTVTSGETFTWLHSPVFRATPLDMKAEADIDFIMGENQLIFHGWPYSPPASQLPPGDPGWSLYAAAVFNDHNPWHPLMPTVDRYIARVSALLRQGQPANQVAILLPTDDALADFSPARVSITGSMARLVPKELIAAILSAGYNFDFIDAEALAKVGLGTHQVLVLPPTDRIPPASLRAIAAFKQHGGKVIAVGHLPSLDPDGKPLPRPAAPPATLVPDTATLSAALLSAASPDFKLINREASSKDQLGFIRRKLPAADIYFVTNTANHPIEATATFATTYKQGFVTDPDTLTVTAASATNQPLHLAPYESRVFIFSGGPSTFRPGPTPLQTSTLPDLSMDWKVVFPTLQRTIEEPTLTDWTASPTTLHFSGEAVYSRDFTLATLPTSPVSLKIEGGKPLPGAPNSPPEHAAPDPNAVPNPLVTLPGPGMHAFYDPPLREAALVTLNGQPAGALWHPPYSLDVTSLLKPGLNHIEIHVFNTALNAWSALPPHDYKPLIAKYGDRFQMQDLDKVQPLPSGILGIIHLVTGSSTK